MALPALSPLYTQEALEADGSPAIRGRLSGACAGPVTMHAATTNQERPLAAIRAPSSGPYVLRVPGSVPLDLRWACVDTPTRVAHARVGSLTKDLPLDLVIIDSAISAREQLVARRSSGPIPLPADGAIAPALADAPPVASAPPDGAVGPPLPEGPPPDAGPPPSEGSAPAP